MEDSGTLTDPRDYNKIKLKGGHLVAAMMEANPGARHSYGVTYILRLPNSRLKIGYTAAKDLVEGLIDRWQSWSREFGGRCEPLATMYGGETLEALLHYQFRYSSVYEEFGEQYYPNQQVLDFALEKGHCPVGRIAVGRYLSYQPRASAA